MAICETEKSFVFPQTLHWSHLNQTGVYNLIKSSKDEYAFYEHILAFGFKHALELEKRWIRGQEDKPLVRVRTLAGNSYGKGTYIIMREDYYRNMTEAIEALQGKTRVYKPKRKPELIRKMTLKEIKEYWNLPKEGKTS